MSTPGFVEAQLDPLISYGSKGGLCYTTIVVSNPSRAKETRFPQQSRGYWKLSLSMSDKKKSQMQAIQSFYAAMGGKAYAWRFRNWREYQVTNEPLPLFSGGNTLQLSRARNIVAGGYSETILVQKPDMVNPITIQRNGAAFPSGGNWTLDTTTGIVTFATSQTGNTFAWTGQFDMPARFDLDMADIEWTDFDDMNWQSIDIMEVQI